jgi:prefoldin subunit 5
LNPLNNNQNKLVETRVSFLEERYEEVNQKIENLQLSLTEKNKKYSSDILELQEIQKKQERKRGNNKARQD